MYRVPCAHKIPFGILRPENAFDGEQTAKVNDITRIALTHDKSKRICISKSYEIQNVELSKLPLMVLTKGKSFQIFKAEFYGSLKSLRGYNL